jgi:hypothetical protein
LGFRVDAKDFGAGGGEGGLSFGGGGFGADDEEVVGGGLDEGAGEGGAEVGVEDDAEQWAAAGEARAVGEGGVVGEDGADAGEDGVGGVAEELGVGAGGGAGEPVRGGGGAGGGGWCVGSRRTVSMWAARSLARPLPRTRGLGSRVAMTQRVMPAAMRASAQGPVRPWWAQGSRVT